MPPRIAPKEHAVFKTVAFVRSVTLPAGGVVVGLHLGTGRAGARFRAEELIANPSHLGRMLHPDDRD